MSDSSAITKTEYEVLAEFRYTLRLFLSFSESAAKEVGITPQQHQALLTIQGFPGREEVTISELSERLQIKHHSAVGLMNRLEAEGMITRSPGRNDRRKVFISLTRRGISVLRKLSHIHREELRRLTPQLRLLLRQIDKLSEGAN
ncbi:MAG TPA: MarR family transcriptional regulator [Anaerolineales bacterium]|nr:MarR family transcriptional regulator [Anaerolineales bacterium]